jgi:hypothetical protein
VGVGASVSGQRTPTSVPKAEESRFDRVASTRFCLISKLRRSGACSMIDGGAARPQLASLLFSPLSPGIFFRQLQSSHITHHDVCCVLCVVGIAYSHSSSRPPLHFHHHIRRPRII